MPITTRARRHPAFVLLAALAGVFALVATTLSTLSTPAQAAAPAERAGTKHAKVAKHDRAWRANAALARAQKALSPDTPASERPDATMALRNLWLLKDALSPADRAVAEKLAARPSKPLAVGDANIVLHYDPAELGYDINTAWADLQYVANTYAGSGYKRPKSDKGKGGDNRTDIYLDQLEPGLYGYCTTDQKVKPPRFDVWAYCVIDADFAGFPLDPISNFRVTAAHEYFHATQFAYDIADDGWFLEATAAWAEDELYDAINDNAQYLKRSPITLPNRPIDKFESNGTFHYGVWNFFRYLTEAYPAKTGALPGLVLKMWQNADSSKGPRKDKYSTQAIDKALKRQKSSMAEAFAAYSGATRYTHQLFSEGAELNYPVKPVKGQVVLPGGKKKTFKSKLDHLTSSTFQFVNGGGASKLKLKFKMGAKKTGARAVVLTYGANGAILGIKHVKVNRKGKASKKFAFDASVAAVEVTLVNASIKYRKCYTDGSDPIACSGKAVYDNIRARVQAKAR